MSRAEIQQGMPRLSSAEHRVCATFTSFDAKLMNVLGGIAKVPCP
jgi:hypothetical protein